MSDNDKQNEKEQRERQEQRSRSRSSRQRRPRRQRGRRGRRREDYFNATGTNPDYKDVDTLRRFLTDRAKIRPRRQTGLSSKNQRLLARQIKRARHLALLPFTDDQQRT